MSYEEGLKAQLISAEDAERIVKCAAPFVKTLAANIHFIPSSYTQSKPLVMFGPFFYKVDDFNSDIILKPLAKNATKITKMIFDKEPKIELLKALFSTNNIKTIKFDECGAFYEHVRTDFVEEMRAIFYNEVKSFEGVSINVN